MTPSSERNHQIWYTSTRVQTKHRTLYHLPWWRLLLRHKGRRQLCVSPAFVSRTRPTEKRMFSAYAHCRRKTANKHTYNGIKGPIQAGTGGPGVAKVLLAGPVDTSSRHRLRRFEHREKKSRTTCGPFLHSSFRLSETYLLSSVV